MIRAGEQRFGVAGWFGVLLVALLVGLVGAGSAGAKPTGNPEEPLEIVPGSFRVTPASDQAGAHADMTVGFDFAHSPKGQTHDDVRNAVVDLPAGIMASNTAVSTCTTSQLAANGSISDFFLPDCPLGSAVGTLSTEFQGRPYTVPIYNMETTSFGVTAELGFRLIAISAVLTASVRPGDTGLTVSSSDIENLGEFRNISVKIWGVPASPEHDLERQQTCEEGTCDNALGGPVSAGVTARPLLSNPTSCGSFTANLKADSWEEPENWSYASGEIGPIGECERVPFEPSIEVQPTTDAAESPSGLNVSVVNPQSWEDPNSISSSNIKETKVTLPVGYTVNPGAGSGLGACTVAQYAAESSSSPPGAGCPEESKIGSVLVETPILAEKLAGAVYVAKPFENQFDSLLGLYVVVKDPARGIIIKLAGHIEPNPVTGQLVTTFPNNPQQPFSRITLKLRQGTTSPLVSPPACGTYTAEADLTPWSEPLGPVHLLSSFQVEHGIGGGACPAGGIPPFHPGLTAGTLNNSAGSYSPMDIHITRNDGEQEITGFATQLPAGLTANLTGVPFCSEADIALARTKSGAQEEASPSCPAASEIGRTLVGAGVGSVLAYTPGKIYLAGPYNGAPFSVVSITSAKVGPFDLGTVVIRFALEINPETAAVTVDAKASDPIPHIIDGIVIHVRDIHVYVDRSNFMINPTSCNPLTFAATVGGGGADPTNPADQQFVTTNTPFQLANCQNLNFEPKISASTQGRTSKPDGASLTYRIAYPSVPQGTEADIHYVKVSLPRELPSRLTTLQKACTQKQFQANPAGCPGESVIGHAKAVVPNIPVPLEGPVYFVSNGGEAFPNLEMVLQGYGVTIDLVGDTLIKNGVTSTTFKQVPDNPLTSFEITLPEGPYSALAANGNLCKPTVTKTVKKKVRVKVKGRERTLTRKVKEQVSTSLTIPSDYIGQNGATYNANVPISVTGCPKAKPAKKKPAKKHRKKK